jgi:hypothetical protein
MTANNRIAWIATACLVAAPAAQGQEARDFNAYILKATAQLAASSAGKGYSRSSSFSRDVPFGKHAVLRARHPPYTMCVSAILETIVTALTIYAEETGDYGPFDYLPRKSWERLTPVDLRGQIWIVKHSNSLGTAHALQNFGMGIVSDFRNIKPGAFINLNRNNRTGHAVVFLAYLDKHGNELPGFSKAVAGFKYFSSQGNERNGGFGYRFAFFSDSGCPTLSGARKRDCGVIRSSSSILLHAGTMSHPQSWNKAQAIEQLEREAFHMKNGDTEMLEEGDYDAGYLSGKTVDD